MMAGPNALASCPHCGEDHEASKLKCPNTDRPLPLEGRTLEDKFRFRKELGTGGMASVWLAVNENLDREVAIKLLRSEVTKNREAVERFMSEARAAARIANPHIAEVYDCGEGPLGPYIIMEALIGHDLATVLRDRVTLPPDELIEIMLDVLDALDAAHNAGIVHRDLKPGNIFLHYPLPGRPVTKLMDFGVSKFLDGTGPVTTRDGILLGTPEYMAPEQLKGASKMDTRADIFSAGAVMYRALTGNFVFRGENLAETLVSMSNGKLEPIDPTQSGAPESLVDVVHKALSVEPEDRYASAHEMAAALREVQQELGVAPLDEEPRSPSERSSDALLAAGAAAAARPLVEPVAAEQAPKGWGAWWLAAGLAAVVAAGAWWWSTREGATAGTTEADEATIAQADAETPAVEAATRSPETATGEGPSSESGIDEAASDASTDEGAAEPAASTSETDESGETGDDEADEADESASSTSEEAPGEGSAGEGTADAPVAEPIAVPPGAFRNGELIALRERASANTHAGARQYCAGLAANSHLGLDGWRMANPAELRSFIGNKTIKTGTYWSSALWKGKAMALRLPAGKKSSLSAKKKSARPFCVIKG